MTGTNHFHNSTSKLPGANFFLIGFMGSGKTYWGKKWAEAHQMDFVDLDDEIEKKAGKTIAQIFEHGGEAWFRELEAAALRACAFLKNTIIACGGGAPCFFDNMQWMNEHGITVYLSATPEQLHYRVSAEREKRPLFNNLGEAEVLDFIRKKLQEREAVYSTAKLVVKTEELTENSFTAFVSLIS